MRTGCAPRWLVAVEPLVHMAFAHHSTVVGSSLVDYASSSHHFPFFLCQRLQCSAALLTCESAWVLQAHPCTAEAIHHTTHSAAHEQHTQRVRRIYTHASSFTSPATEKANSSLAPCVSSSVADLSSGWHVDGPLVCACSPLVSRSIPLSLLLPSSIDCSAAAAADKFPKRHRAKQAWLLLSRLWRPPSASFVAV